MRLPASVIGLALMAAALGCCSSSADCLDYAEYPHWTGNLDTGFDFEKIAVVGTLIYGVAGWGGLDIIDVANPDTPSLLGSVETKGYACGVAVAGNYACVLERYYFERYDGLEVIDITNPQAPRIVGSLETQYSPTAVAISGSYAFVFANDLFVIDISVPEIPRIVATLDVIFTDAIVIVDKYAYLAGDGLQVIDITNPLAPKIMGSVGGVRGDDVVISDHYAFIISTWMGFHVIDVTDPHAPTIVSTLDACGGRLWLSGEHLFTTGACWPDFSSVINVADPLNPQLEYTNYLWGGRDLAVLQDRVYFAGEAGVLVVDFANLIDPPLTGSVGTQSVALDVAVADNRAYVADYDDFMVINVADPTNPQILTTVEMPWTGRACAVAVAGGSAYVADGAAGLQVVDLTTYEIVGWEDTPGSASDVAIQGGYAYIADDASGFQVVDISNPKDPRLVGSLSTPAATVNVTISGAYAYLAMSIAGVGVVDISDPPHPHFVAQTSGMGAVQDVAVSETYAYVVSSHEGLIVLGIADPAQPQVIGSLYIPWGGSGIAITRAYAYIAALAELDIVDITDPCRPSIAGCSGPANLRVTVADDYVYLPRCSDSVVQIRLAQCEPTSEVVAADAFSRGTVLYAAPNPSLGRTVIRFDEQTIEPMRACIVDISGHQVRELSTAIRNGGTGEFYWDGLSGNGQPVPAGIYLARISTAGGTKAARVVITR